MSDLENRLPEANTALLEMTAEVVAAYVTKNHVRAAELRTPTARAAETVLAGFVAA